ncbi:MAG: 16S rRNA (guanine(527)-N(7))-methyltransferase RsmG [Deltaproteobacteria bacterium]|nr:16S rRNA (guanine(527)-N(7))-methyltransferase RsmG [Deltaproteobacteria bacterium]
MAKDFKEMLTEGAAMLNVTLDGASAGKFTKYKDELKAWNKKINLTAIESDADIVVKHFLDSLTLCRFLKGTGRLLDIGSGGGFPGIPLKLAMPGLNVTLLDSVHKKVFFMRHVIRTLGLKGIEAFAGRAEDRAVAAAYKNSFDCVTARGLSELKSFILMGLPFLKPDGIMLAIKGMAITEELKAASGIDGMGTLEVFEAPLPFSKRTTTVVVIRRAR